MEITTRPIQNDDLLMLANIFVDAYKPENTGEYWTIETAYKVMKYWHSRAPRDLQILAQADNEIVGAFFVDVKPWWNGYRLVDGEFFVLTDYQKQGVGKKMLNDIITIATEIYKCTHFETTTFMPEDGHPLKWYKKLGFEKDDGLVIINAEINRLRKNLDE